MENVTSMERMQLHAQFFIGQRDNLYHLSVDRSIILKADLTERE
jgi:hypothetical protein